MTVIPLQSRYDMVLGKPWLAAHNPNIDFARNTIEVRTGEKVYCLLADKQEDRPLQGEESLPRNANVVGMEFMNIQQARKALKRGAECIFVSVKNTNDGQPEEKEKAEFPDSCISDRLDHDKRQDLQRLLSRHATCFPRELPMRLPPSRRTDHEIKVEEGSRPPSRPPYRMSAPELDELQRQLQELLEHGFIETSNSPYGAPVFFIKKADGSLRLVCDWRALNRITTKVQACLPNIEDLFDCVRGARYFSKLDLKSGYHQVRVQEEDVPKTAINTPFGQFQYRVMGFGLTNAPATFMSVMNDVLRPFLRKCVIVFLDDILVFSRSWREHLCHVDAVLRALKEDSLFCNPAKCQFGMLEVKFLGHVVSGSSLSPDPEKLEAVEQWPFPKTITEVRRFLGFTNFFRRFIEDYSSISRPLERLTGKNARFVWNAEQQEGFDKLRMSLLQSPVLAIADVNRPFRVITDASDTAIGGVLLQKDDAGEWHPVAYTSRRLRPEESNYTIMERETLAAMHALRVWRLYLFNHFELVTDNQGVAYLQTKKNLSKREARWAELLAEFDVEIVHRPGKENLADPLSRVTDVEDCQISDPSRNVRKTDEGEDSHHDVKMRVADESTAEDLGLTEVSVSMEPRFKELLTEGYHQDKKMRHIIQRLERNPKLQDPYVWNIPEKRLYFLSEGNRRLCIPKGPLRLELLKLCHDVPSSGHPGRDRTYSRLARSYWWPRMSQDVKRFVRSCKKCQHSKGDRPRQAPLQCLPVPSEPWQDISMDFITGLPESSTGSNAVLTFIDRLSKQAHFVPTKTTVNAVDTADLYIQNIFRLHGLSRSIVSDRDPRFTSEVYRNIFNRLGVDLKFSTANHPQTDGLTERVHRTIEQILRSAVHHRQTNWEEMLPMCEFAYNDMIQASTCETPFFMNNGHHPVSLPELVFDRANADRCQEYPQGMDWLGKKQKALSLAKDSIRAALDNQIFYADRQRQDTTFKEGDKVLIHRDYLSTDISRDQPCAKLAPRWLGPFQVLDVPSLATVRVQLPPSCKAHPVFNVAALRHFHEDASLRGRPEEPPAPVLDLDGHERYLVEEILSERKFRGRRQFLVKWIGYEVPTWEPEVNVLDESGRPIVELRRFLEAKGRRG